MIAALESIFTDSAKSLEAQEAMWSSFGEIRNDTLLDMWKTLLSSMACDSVEERLFVELINEVLLKELIKFRFKFTPPPQQKAMAPSLTKEEENIIRYVCGYVGMKLHDRYIQMHGKHN